MVKLHIAFQNVMIKVNENYGLVDAFIFPGASNEYALYSIKAMTTSLEPPAFGVILICWPFTYSIDFPLWQSINETAKLLHL